MLSLESAERIEVLSDNHGASISSLLTHRSHLSPLALIDIELANFICRHAMGKITTDDIDESLMIEAGETRASIWDPFTAPHSIVFQVPLLHLIAYIFSNLVA